MTNLSVSLPDPMRAWIDDQVREGRYGNASEYVRELIRRDQERRAQERLEALLIEGLESGPAREMTRADWNDLKKRLTTRQKERGGNATK